jgi:tripartite-type tricarboxylate transporter receptor subunit TctC
VNPAVPAKTLKEFITLAKAQPNSITVASAGNGTTQHLGSELFKLMTKTEMVHVPYKGSGPAVTDVIGGQVQATFETGPAALTQIKAGRLRAIATATKERMLPDVPNRRRRRGCPASRSPPLRAARARRHAQGRCRAHSTPRSRRSCRCPMCSPSSTQQGVIPTFTTPEKTAQHIHGEVEKWAKVIKAANVKAD